MLLLLGGCSKYTEEPQPGSLLNVDLPDVQVPLSDTGTGVIDISSVNHLYGNYSVEFGAPRHGRIVVNADSSVFQYIANADFQGKDTAMYTITKYVLGNKSVGDGTLYFHTNPAVCFVKAADDVLDVTDQGASGPWLLTVLKNDEVCGDVSKATISGWGSATAPGGVFTLDVEGNLRYSHPGWYGTDSTSYTITKNGFFTSTAKVKVVRTKPVDCDSLFQPKQDTIWVDSGVTDINHPVSVLLGNDESCPGDLDTTSFALFGNGNLPGGHAELIHPQVGPAFVKLYVYGDTAMHYGWFDYTVRRAAVPGAVKSARVYIERR